MERPKIKIILTPTDTVLEILGWLSIVAIWVLTITNYAGLPDTIPVHYNALGQPDRFGGKATLLAMPIIATVLFIGITILNRFPHVFNYPTAITPENALRQYTIATRLFRYMKLIISLFLGLIVFMTIQNARGEADGLGWWFLPAMLGLIIIPAGYFLVKAFRNKT